VGAADTTRDRDPNKELFTASDVARFCQVDLKTIHNWADRGEIRHFRTPGRHLRFRRVDVLDFLRKYGYPVPDVLMQGKPRVLVLDTDAISTANVKRALGKRFEVSSFEDPIDAMIAIGAEAPDVVVLDAKASDVEGMHVLRRLKTLDPTRHVRVVVFSQDDSIKKEMMDAGAQAFVSKPHADKLRESLEQMMGLERTPPGGAAPAGGGAAPGMGGAAGGSAANGSGSVPSE
jgi:excisionase family DNA binding protein